MPKVEVNECDVFGTRGDDVLETEIAITRKVINQLTGDVVPVHSSLTMLLSDRGHKRLLAALVPPKTRNTVPKP